ncbi:MAG TPA: CBS domain-containing protein [Acidimicrobiales bacterium]|nr:CBS domain-containing protein [Acidimicrobiales bacterium]
METLVRDYMTRDPITVPPTATIEQAAQEMRVHDVGALLLIEDGQLVGLVTDRDLTVRGAANGADPVTTPVAEVATPAPVSLHPEQPLAQAIDEMARQAVRRLPVVEHGRPVGILSLGDLAIARADGSDGGAPDAVDALGEISAAEGPSARQAAMEQGTPNTRVPGPRGDLP